MAKYTITVSYVCEADSEIGASFALHRSLYPLGEEEFDKFTPIKIEEIN